RQDHHLQGPQGRAGEIPGERPEVDRQLAGWERPVLLQQGRKEGHEGREEEGYQEGQGRRQLTRPRRRPAVAGRRRRRLMAEVEVAAVAQRIVGNVEKVIIGKRPAVTLTLVAALCEGHVLLEDVPGVAKTMLARAFAKSIGGSFKRVQCTPNLLPTAVTGGPIFNQKPTGLEFRPGPSLRKSWLAEGITRATPRPRDAPHRRDRPGGQGGGADRLPGSDP